VADLERFLALLEALRQSLATLDPLEGRRERVMLARGVGQKTLEDDCAGAAGFTATAGRMRLPLDAGKSRGESTKDSPGSGK
jgi:hypothetical protein